MKRHAAVFVLVLVAASLVAWWVPYDVDPNTVFFYFMLAFAVYLAGSWLWESRHTG
jgi:hypothetical protein